MNEQTIAATLQTAYAALQRGDLGGASGLVAGVLSQHPNRADALHLHALVLRAKGDRESARRALEQAVAAAPNSAETRNTLGNLLIDLGRLDEAEAQFAAANAAQPAYAAAWVNRGRLWTMRDDPARAIGYLERALTLDPQSVPALTSLGDAHRASGDYDRAGQAMRRAVAIAPRQLGPRLNLAFILRGADRQREAIAEYDAAEREGLRQPQLLEGRGAAWLELGEPEKARADYDRMTSEFPSYLQGHRARARLYWEAGLKGDPFESFRTLSENHPRETTVWSEWLSALLSFRRFSRAVEVAEAAERATGDRAAFLGAKAVALSETGQMIEAQAAFEACLPLHGAQAEFLEAFARHLVKMQAPERAAEVAQQVVAIAPDSQLGWAYLGTAWRMLSDAREFWINDYEQHVTQIEARPPGFEDSGEDFARSVAPALRALHLTKVHPADQTLRNGTQTPGALFDRPDPAIRQIKAAVRAAAEAFSRSLPDDPGHPLLRRKSDRLRFTGSWSVRLTRHGFHVNHVHGNGWLSSAFYFALPDPQPDDPPHSGWLQLGAPPDDLELGLPARRLIQPRVGTLVLFPSFMWHGTVPFTSEGERLTAAFDIVPA